MDKQQYQAIRARLAFRPSVAWAAGTVVVHLATLAFGLWLLQRPGWTAYFLAQAVLAVAFFQAFGILHECGHGSFARSKAVNTLVGHLASIVCFTPFYTWKYIHQEHHVWAGHVHRDPSLRKLSQWRRTGRVPWTARLAWRSWLPFVGLVQQFVYWLYPVQLARQGKAARAKLRHSLASTVFLLAAYTGIGLAAWALSFSLHIVVAVAVYLFIVELVNLPHHTDLPDYERKLRLWEQSAIARSCYYPPVVSELCVLNFNFHTEHHLFPTLPWYRLRRARTLVKEALGGAYNEAVGVQWNVENRSRSLHEVVSHKQPGDR